MFFCKKKKCGQAEKCLFLKWLKPNILTGTNLSHINTHIPPPDVLVLISKGFISSSTPPYNNKIAYTQIIVQSLLYLGISISYRYLARLQLVPFFFFFRLSIIQSKKKFIIAHNTNFQVPIILATLKAPKWKYR